MTLKGRHRIEHPALRALRQLLAVLAYHWQLTALAVLGAAALIVAVSTAASAHPAPTPPHVGLITSGAVAGATEGTS
jgi:hypothetical protein